MIDRNSRLASLAAPVANWLAKTDPQRKAPLSRRLMEWVLGIHREAVLPRYVPAGATLMRQTENRALLPNSNAPASKSKRKVLLYATCYGNWNKPSIGLAARQVLAHNGVEVKTAYPGCCGMPQLEQGDLRVVAEQARNIASYMVKRMEEGWNIVALVPSCALMMKQEWSSLLPKDKDVQRLSQDVKDISEYVMDIARKEGLTPGLHPVDAGVSLHNACHSRAQNVGFKAEEMLRLIPSMSVSIVESCSGHGGLWGVKTATFPTAVKVGERAVKRTMQNIEHHTVGTEGEDDTQPAARRHQMHFLSSECPLAAGHIKQGLPASAAELVGEPKHPIELLAHSYQLPIE